MSQCQLTKKPPPHDQADNRQNRGAEEFDSASHKRGGVRQTSLRRQRGWGRQTSLRRRCRLFSAISRSRFSTREPRGRRSIFCHRAVRRGLLRKRNMPANISQPFSESGSTRRSRSALAARKRTPSWGLGVRRLAGEWAGGPRSPAQANNHRAVSWFPNTRVIYSLALREHRCRFWSWCSGRGLVSVVRVRVAGGPDAPRGGLLSKQGRRV
jgi:hypothetical protein